MQEEPAYAVRAGRAEKERLRAPTPEPRTAGRTRFVLKDVRIFLNSLERAAALLRQGGVAVELAQRETEEALTVMIHIRR